MDDVAVPGAEAPASPVRALTPASGALALLTGAVVALVGGLLWSGAEIVTGYDIGFVAWFIGIATSVAMIRVAGRSAVLTIGVVAGLLAAAGIIVGKYVTFVHDARADDVAVGYLDGVAMRFFRDNFSDFVRPIDYLWLLLAVVAAVRTAGRTGVAEGPDASLTDGATSGAPRGMRQCIKDGCELRYGPTTAEVCESCGNPTQQTSVPVVS